MTDIYSFGYWVRRRRKALDLTQRELADAVGCALVTLKKIETDRRRPSLEMAARLADCLALPAAERDDFLIAARGERPVDTLNRPATVTLLPPRDVVPAAPMPLIGRESEIATLLALLGSADIRLVSLTGPGGIGKTRLALASAEALRQARPRTFTAGIVFVDLAAVMDAGQVAPAVAAALGFTLDARAGNPKSQVEQLADFLRPRDALLILDNLEQVVGGRAFVSELLGATDAPKLLVTSRERLDLAWEHLVALPGLAYSGETTTDPTDFPAGQLFLARACRLRPDFRIEPDDRGALADLCALVDGMPLALELAAAWVDTLSLVEIAAELRQDLGILSTNRDDMPERHRSLRAVWDSTWARLEPAEREAFARLCVFRGGFTRAAAEAVGGVTLGALGRLTGKYLIAFHRGAGRYRIHELLRQYGYANLEALGTHDDAHRRQFDYLLTYAETLAPRIHGPEQTETLRRLAAESDNFHAALEWVITRPKPGEEVARMLSALHWFWRIRSRVVEATAQTERAILLPGLPLAAEAGLLFEAGHFAWMRGDFTAARDHHAAALARWEAIGRGDSLEAAIARQHLAMTYHQLNDQEATATHSEAAMARYRALDATWWLTFILPLIAQNRFALGNRKGSDEAAAEHLRLVARLGDPWLMGLGRLNLGELAMNSGDLRRARQLIEEGLAVQRTTGHIHSVGSALMMLGRIALRENDGQAASTCFTEALTLYEEMGAAGHAADARALLASAA